MNTKVIGLWSVLFLLVFVESRGRTLSFTEKEMPLIGNIAVSPSPNWTSEILNTTTGTNYLTPIEREVIIEINMMRTDPAVYARKYLMPLRAYYEGNLLKYPGEIAIATSEGVAPLEECIRELEHTNPLSTLTPKKGLMLAARGHAADQAKSGATGHTGSDGSSMVTRLSRYGEWSETAGENISYGYNDARKIVISLLIDDGVPSRGHRINLLNDNFKVVGIGVGPHREYQNMCVMDFAGGYTSKKR